MELKTSCRGFSLVEMMIVIAIIGLLAMASTAMTAAWVSDAKIDHASNVIKEGYGRAKASSMRNRHGIFDGQPSSMLCLRDAVVISVHEPIDLNKPATCESPTIWTAKIAKGISVKSGDNAFSCYGFDSMGMASKTSSAAQCSNQVTALSISHGGNDVIISVN